MKKPQEKSTIGAMPNLDAMDALVSGKNNDNAANAPAVAVVPRQRHEAQTKEATTTMTTRLSVSFHKRLKRHAVDTGESLQDFTVRALEAMLSVEQQAS